MKYVLILLSIAFAVFMFSCGSGSSAPVNPGNNNPIIDIPDVPGGDNHATTTVTTYYPTPTRDGTGAMGDGQIAEMQMLVDLNAFTGDKNLSALTNLDREKVEATANAIAYKLYEKQHTGTMTGDVAGTWAHVFPWQSDGTTFNRNTVAQTHLGLLQYVELYDLYDPADPNKTPLNDLYLADLAELLDNGATPGLVGFCYNTAMAAHDTLANTNTDRPFSGEVILLSRAANVFNNPSYQYMAETWFAEIADEFSGAEYATRLITNRLSLALWDGGGYMLAATLTGNTEWVDFDSGTDVGKTPLFTAVTDEDDGMMQEYDQRIADWENVLYGGWDYTNLGWCYLPAALSEQKLYAALTTVADGFYTDALDALKGNSFRHRSYGYYGYEDSSRLYDDSQTGGYALIGLGFADQNDFLGSDVSLMRVLDGQLEFFNTRIGADIAANTNIDLVGGGDAGAVRNQYRGTFPITTGVYNFEVMSEVLSGMTVAAEQTFRFPDVPMAMMMQPRIQLQLLPDWETPFQSQWERSAA